MTTSPESVNLMALPTMSSVSAGCGKQSTDQLLRRAGLDTRSHSDQDPLYARGRGEKAG